ncbi:hypothetical protein LMH73_020205 [Vibrio splendidus]|nr:hypothetical protein [Vibrio splendidus]MCC4882935.1 hypothetical protein [Vibrio splendidus]
MKQEFIPQGKMADLHGIPGIAFYNARRGTPTTEIESFRPFLLRFHPSSPSGQVKESIAMHRSNNHTIGKAEDWVVTYNDHSAEDDERFFEVVFLQSSKKESTFAWKKEGNELLQSFLSPFINQDDEFCGSITGVGMTMSADSIDMTSYHRNYLNDLLGGVESISCFAEKRGLSQIVISHRTVHSNIERLLCLNVATMQVTTAKY